MPCLSHERPLYPFIWIATVSSLSIINFDRITLRPNIPHWWWADWSLEVFSHSTPESGHDEKGWPISRLPLDESWMKMYGDWPNYLSPFTVGILEWIQVRLNDESLSSNKLSCYETPVSIFLFGEFSHDTIIVASSFGFLKVLKLCYLLLFSKRKLQNKKKASGEKLLLANISTMGALQNMIETEIWEDTVQDYHFLFFFPL